MTRLRSLIKEVLSTPPKKKDCNCGCGGCDKKAPIITEGRIKKAISEGLTYHVENKIPLHESVYRIGSEKHFALINEARKLWVRGLIDVSKDDQAILETHLGNFGMYEGEKVPLDMPMVNEENTFPDSFTVKDTLHYTPEIDGKPKKLLKGTYFLRNSQGDTAVYFNQAFKSEVEIDNDDIFNFKRLKSNIKIDEGFKDYLGYSDHTRSDSGLNVIPKDQIHANKLSDAIEDSGMYAEWNTREGYFFFPEEEDRYDQLEMEIQDLMDENNIQGYIEGVFEESLKEGQDKWVVYDTKTKKRLPNAGKIYKDRKAAQAFADKQENAEVASDTFYFDKIQKSLNEETVDYDFSKEELIRVIKQLKRGASTEVGMIKAFEKALGRELTDDEIRGFKLNEKVLSENQLDQIEDWKFQNGWGFIKDYRRENESGPNKKIAFLAYDSEEQKDLSKGQSLNVGRLDELIPTLLNDINKSQQLVNLLKKDYLPSAMKITKDMIKKADVDMVIVVNKNVDNNIINESKKKKKKDPPLNKPERGGSKAYFVYVRDPKTKKIQKVSFGSGGLRAKIKNKEARNAFAARHNCKNKKDRTTAGYWSCNLPRYAEQLGLGSNMNTFW